MQTCPPPIPDEDNSDKIDTARSIDLAPHGSPEYWAALIVSTDGEEHLALICHPLLTTDPAAPYWPSARGWSRFAPHELTGRPPRPFAPTCGRPASSTGKPCRHGVPTYGDACFHHAELTTERAPA